MIKTVFKYFCV